VPELGHTQLAVRVRAAVSPRPRAHPAGWHVKEAGWLFGQGKLDAAFHGRRLKGLEKKYEEEEWRGA
jgi:hypothetical protein